MDGLNSHTVPITTLFRAMGDLGISLLVYVIRIWLFVLESKPNHNMLMSEYSKEWHHWRLPSNDSIVSFELHGTLRNVAINS